MQFGLMFFAGSDAPGDRDRYRLLRAATAFADEHGFAAVWTPERHFHAFGGLFPNPSVLGAALAATTTRVQIRAGSVIAPLHDPIRIAEEWSVVDNLSDGRVAVSFGSGWNADDFVFHPDRYGDRHRVLYADIDAVRRLWRGDTIVRENGVGRRVDVRLHPRPLQPELPVWVTSSGHVDTFVSAGRIGANVLTHLIGQDLEALAAKIRRYREARHAAGLDASTGIVSLMLHTFVGTSVEDVEAIVAAPFRAYLVSALRLETRAVDAGGVISGGHQVEPHRIPDADVQDLADAAFRRYFHRAALLGTVDSCQRLIHEFEACGVDEVACLIDFGPSYDQVLASLQLVNRLRIACSDDARACAEAAALTEFSAPLS
jgi:natural product biosynthesis luciferase-like monooxygenase protein